MSFIGRILFSFLRNKNILSVAYTTSTEINSIFEKGTTKIWCVKKFVILLLFEGNPNELHDFLNIATILLTCSTYYNDATIY